MYTHFSDHLCLQGGDLDMKITEHKKAKKQFDEKTVLDWFVQLLMAVHYMHSRRVLHRDLKTRYTSLATDSRFNI